tara:strand:- start:397 stop:561 length:165 start_codon:yes stop_codon:yes gene_type:complete
MRKKLLSWLDAPITDAFEKCEEGLKKEKRIKKDKELREKLEKGEYKIKNVPLIK